ncbi:Hypothetical predicted protein [Mytilus galloprovincialis]|uniref:Mab-21-like HhH/H2TH-like domain-containing protein n=1 Tax=Mytilus galloprovincialis TaxID=29158 RepID=A0A8B6G0I8_MYTGA|nr:Hypothetical predicted protein [Mytilus galloprovincialis]
MDKNSRTQENDDDENVYGMRKITYLEKYGVKHFPYCGRRKYTPLIHKSVDEGIFISNDVFGLTIRQFERMYKDCLHRRKTHEQWILNLRYPDKSSNDYLEYLQNCTDCNTDNLTWPDNELKEKDLFELLVTTIGTEIDIRTRQRLFIIQDMIHNAMKDLTLISSGSLAEGLDLPGSDLDKMYVLTNVDVIDNIRNIKQPKQRTTCTLVMVTDHNHPGFTKLRLVETLNEGIRFMGDVFERTTDGCYLSANGFINEIKKVNSHNQLSTHGPCLTFLDQMTDVAFCYRSKFFPLNAIPWVWRHRRQWPTDFLIDQIKQYGCLIVPVGPKNISDSDSFWRLSFSVAEKKLVHSFNFTQLLCYGLLKLTLKRIVNTNNDIKDLLCSYFLKTALFWVSEEVDIDTFQIPKLFTCFFLCLNKLMSWVNNCYCPNYFIPEHNMFLGKITPDNNKILSHVLSSIQVGGIDGFMRNLFSPYNANYLSTRTKGETSFIKLDFLFYRIHSIFEMKDTVQWYNVLTLTESLRKSESSPFIIDVCKIHYALFCQYAVQTIPPPITINKMHNTHKSYHRYLLDGIKADAVSGWLSYTSFYYVIGQYNVTLKLTDYVLSRCLTDMVRLEFDDSEERINSHRRNVHSTMSLIERIKIAAVASVEYLKYSSLIPGELQLEVEHSELAISPIVMSHCLRFLCYHHLGNICYRQKALHKLYLAVEKEFNKGQKLISYLLTILGVCMELSGNKNTAYECFQTALKSRFRICPSAKIRISKLFDVCYDVSS